MRFQSVTVCCLLFTTGLFAQTDRGAITGTVLDPAEAAIAGAAVVARGVDTGSRYQTATTVTGNYTLASLPAGVYEVSVEAAGFKKFTQQGIAVQVAQTIRIDFALQIGAASESITVTAAAPLLKTENAEQSTTISRDSLYKLPLNFGAVQSGAIRNALAFVALSPGAYIQPGSQNTIRVNGTPNISFKIMLEGQDATNSITQATSNHLSPSVEAVEEFTLQSSNFAAEFGQVVGGLFNFTARSGTNQYHGGAYDYLVNDALNAGQPYTDDGHGHLVRPAAKKNDAGITVGGPLIVPKLYNGRNRTFFFLGVEGYVDRKRSQSTGSVPTDAMRNGDFSAILTNRNLASDPLGRAIMENTVYDPATQHLANGQVVRDPFPGNIIPKSRIDPVAAKIQAYIPTPTSPGLVNNWTVFALAPRNQVIQSLKLDHNFHSNSKLSFYSQYYRDFEFNSSPDGLPAPITTHREKHIYTYTARLNYDQSITPTLLLHAGIGEQRLSNPDTSPKVVTNFDELGQLGLVGGAANPSGFPRITGLNATLGGFSVSNQGSIGMGPTNLGDHYFTDKPTFVLNLTHVRGSHTYKAGGEFRIDTFTQITRKGQSGNFVFSALETGLPSTLGQNLGGGTVGFPYASFLLGAVDSATVNSPQDPQLRKKSWSLFAQDTWKVTRKLTIDYGIRYDLQGQGDEIHNRLSEFSPTTPNPSAGGLLGATIYEGYGQGRCNCLFTKRYPYAFGPRLGVAYQINSKTVFRGGWGVAYGPTPEYNYLGSTAIVGVGGYNQISFTSPSYGDPAVLLRNGLQYNPANLYSSSLNPGIRPNPGQIDSPPYWIDPNGGRVPRIMQWSLGLQRQITGDLMVEAAYVGNRGAWEEANNLIDLNGLTPQRISAAGLDINSAADRTLLTSRLDSALAQSRGFKAPYTGYPLSLTVAQTLRPFPQFGNIAVWWASVGNNWYDSLQVKVTKRYSHGLTATAAFTWQKELVSGADGGPVNDVYNRRNQKIISPSSQPFVVVTAFGYQLQPWGVNKWMKAAVRDWTFGGILRYASGMPIQVPAANNALSSLLFRGTFANRVPGQPLFLQDLNCHCFDPNTTFVLNPKAWTDPAAGQWGTSAAFYNDYRYARRPDESLSMGRVFRIREGMSFQIRAEFFNPFNRTYLNNPDSTNAGTAQKVTNGQIVSGFGRISTGTTYLAPRNGQVIARFQW